MPCLRYVADSVLRGGIPMKLKVLIHRQTAGEPQEGTLRGYVLAGYLDGNGKEKFSRGQNLLCRKKFTKLDSAVSECDKIIMAEYKLIDPPEIEWVIEDGAR